MQNLKQSLTLSEPESLEQDTIENPEPVVEPREINGPAGLEPTRYGDWERKGRCVDF